MCASERTISWKSGAKKDLFESLAMPRSWASLVEKSVGSKGEGKNAVIDREVCQCTIVRRVSARVFHLDDCGSL